MSIIRHLFFRPIGILGLTTILLISTGVTPITAALTLLALATIQNVTYSLQSRASMRSSIVYHLITSMLVTVVFFATLRTLVHSAVTLTLLVPYMLGTVLGNTYGVVLSTWIERKISTIVSFGTAATNYRIPKGVIVGACAACFGAAVMLPLLGFLKLGLLCVIAFLQNAIFAILRTARSTDSYGFHLSAVLAHGIFTFMLYTLMVEEHMQWSIFVPYALAVTAGTMLGAESAKVFATYLKTSCDAHVLDPQHLSIPYATIALAGTLLIPHFFYFGIVHAEVQILTLLAAGAQQCAVSLISRARQRNHLGYIEWSSVCSNGIWFLTFNLLVGSALAPYVGTPFIVGTAVGSLIGQYFAMRIEHYIGARMVDIAPHKVP